MKYPFTQDEAREAHEAWGCNCGPTALAFALQTTLDEARVAIKHFDERRYTSPTMMREAIAALGRTFIPCRAPLERDLFHDRVALVRIQWTGPWTQPAPRKWAARYTHWIVTWLDGVRLSIFDVNSGMVDFVHWRTKTAKAITDTINNADGGWYPSNIWRLDCPATPAMASDAGAAFAAVDLELVGRPLNVPAHLIQSKNQE
ncbi:MAG: hypothetical protein AB7U73_08210 [Pirellulales bacterium]